MAGKKKYPYWMAVEESKTVRFTDLAHMMAKAMHPGNDEAFAYAAARINLETELPQAVRDGVLKVRNPAGLGLHAYPRGDALQRAVLIPETDLLEPFLNERGIELRLTPHGSGPDYWTLENAAAAMQEQLKWHDGTRAEFQDQMQEAAQGGALVILDPCTCLPIHPERVRTYWEYLTPAGVSDWLSTLKAPYRWSPAVPLVKVPHKSPRDFKPWETLVPFFEPLNGLYMYEQAARAIGDAEGWDDSKLEALLAEMIRAINDGSLPIRSRKTGMVIAPNSLDALELVTVNDVNEWLESKRVPYRWKVVAAMPADNVKPELAIEAITAPPDAYVIPKIKTRQRDTLDPVIELAQTKCRNPKDTTEVWAKLQPMADKQEPPLFGATDEGLQYLKAGTTAIFTRDALRKRLNPSTRGKPGKRR